MGAVGFTGPPEGSPLDIKRAMPKLALSMPLYEYLCDSCRKVSEVMQKFSDHPLETCPVEGCGGRVVKLVSMSSFALKGSGWYTTDYKPKPAAAAQKTESAPAAEPAKPTKPEPAKS
jgi:putative FmdB family regulatory protein